MPPSTDDIRNNSLVIDLETLNAKYKTLLIQYKQSTMDYVNFLKNENHYIIICVGTDGNLYSRKSVDAPSEKIQDDSNGKFLSLCTSNDGKTIIGCNISNNLEQKPSWDAPKWQGNIQTPGNVMSVAVGQDGTVIGVGMNNGLWSKPNLNGNWTQASSPGGEWISSICIAPDGSIFCIGSNSAIFKKDSYKNLPSQQWQYLGNNTCCVKAITIAPDGTFIGVGTDNQLYTKASYKDLTTNWIGPYSQSTNIISITTVANNINQQLIKIPGSVYWGKSALSQNSSGTLQDCQASCASTSGCSGATFNATANGKQQCFLRSGDSDIGTGVSTDYAIVPEGKYLLMNIQDINKQLLDTNNQIQKKTVEGQAVYDKQIGKRETDTKELVQQFDQLTKERGKFEKMVNEYQDLDQQQSEGDIHINKNYYSFILLLGIAIIVIIVLFYFTSSTTSSTNMATPLIQSGGELGKNAYYFIFGIILVILIIHYYKNYFYL